MNEQQSALCKAIKDGNNIEVEKLLLEMSTTSIQSLNFVDENRQNILHIAISSKQALITKFILNNFKSNNAQELYELLFLSRR